MKSTRHKEAFEQIENDYSHGLTERSEAHTSGLKYPLNDIETSQAAYLGTLAALKEVGLQK